jgi:hypothetical protein
MPIYVGLGNWTDQGTKDFGGAVQRGNAFQEAVEQAGGRIRELVWTMGAYDFIAVLEAPDELSGRQSAPTRGQRTLACSLQQLRLPMEHPPRAPPLPT